VQPVDLEEGCPECGVVSSRVHAWSVQRVRDVPHAGRVEVVVRKPRLACVEPACGRRTFTPVTDQLPARARCTTRLRTRVLAAVIDSGRANLMVSRVRQRLIREREQRRGRKIDPAWANRTLLLRGYDTLSARARTRLDHVLAVDDPTQELSAAWGVKEQLRRLLHVDTVEQARREKMILGCYVIAADMDETWRLWHTIQTWWPAVELLIRTRVTNARTEAANTGIKQIKRTGADGRRPVDTAAGLPVVDKRCPEQAVNPRSQG
jgi:transposase